MASIPNLNTLRTGRRGPRLRRGGRGGIVVEDGGHETDADVDLARDRVVQQTDGDASSSRMSAVTQGYLHDSFARLFADPDQPTPRRYPIINRGTYVRTKTIDKLVLRFLSAFPEQRKQIVSLGAGSDTRFFRFIDEHVKIMAQVDYHELDFESNVNRKRTIVRQSEVIASQLRAAEKLGVTYNLQALDLRDLTKKSPPSIPLLDADVPTLLLSECCVCYLAPDLATSVLQYFTMNLRGPLALVVYEPIRPHDAFGKTMVSNLASRGIHLHTLQRYATLDAQRRRLQAAGFTEGQSARDMLQLWRTEQWTPSAEVDRLEKLEWLDEVEEWHLLARHYCVAWGWRGFGDSTWLDGLEGSRTTDEDHDEKFAVN